MKPNIWDVVICPFALFPSKSRKIGKLNDFYDDVLFFGRPHHFDRWSAEEFTVTFVTATDEC